ncbi:MAG: hypothetical protein JJLCMIEE_01094 [Acidimicrobiales bacterium]|nr:MAG: ABC transporter permease [Actinomycetota bacterium]MBV6508035.1 hypothetical protein [Acidimicrobiales bacterium]RIK05336.1 MAG: ABC transporter permease [Acidobacteriota bacterium]
METFLAPLLLGLGSGAVYALFGSGVVLTYRASGVVNFAVGAMAMCTTFVFAELRSSGDLHLPVPGLPSQIHLADEVPFLVALIISLAFAALLGLVSYLLVFRPLLHASALAKVVGAVGLMITLQAFVVLRFGSATLGVAPILPSEPVELLGMNIPRDRIYLAVLAVLLGVGLWALYRFTAFGLATRASAENETGIVLLGRSRNLLAALNWTLAGVLSGAAGILLAPLTLLDPGTFTLLVVPALGAALIGRFSRFGLTVAGGLALGMAQAGIIKLQASVSWLPRVGLREGIPFLVILVVVALGGRVLPSRGAIVERRAPQPPQPRRVLASTGVLVALGAAGLFILQGSYRAALIASLIAALVCLSLVVLTGFVGQISLGQMAFAGIAGFALSKLGEGVGIPFPLAPLLAACIAALAGLAVGVPALRVRGVNLAIATLAAAVAIEELVFKNPDLTGGFEGSKVPLPHLWGLDLSIGGESSAAYPRVAFGIFALVVVALVGLGVANLRRSTIGRQMLAVRANERAAAAAGIDVAATKLVAFGISAFIAGMAGAMIGYQFSRVSFTSFSVFASLTFVAVAFIGGINRVSGALIGGLLVANGLLFTVLEEWAGLGKYQLMVSGIGLIVAAALWPEGIAGAIGSGWARLRSLIKAPGSTVVEVGAADDTGAQREVQRESAASPH